LFPGFAKAREAARRASCQSNLRQIGLGFLQYVETYDGKMPRSFFGTPGDSTPEDSVPNNYKWMDAIFPFIKDEKLFNCPSDGASNLYRFRDTVNYGSYGLNGAYGAVLTDNQTPPRSANNLLVDSAQIIRPSQTVWVTDNNNSVSTSNPGGSQGFFWPSPAANPSITTTEPRQLQNIVERHLGTTATLFCDGHVKSMRLEVLAAKKTLIDPKDGQTKDVMTFFTIEDD
jgi:prepilin-type processing-associated H-X9-DG protein